MAERGKRVIYVGPAPGKQHKPLYIEAELVFSGSLLPGTLLKLNEAAPMGLESDNKPSTLFGQVSLVLDKRGHGSAEIEDVVAVGENVRAIQPRSGEFINVLVITGQVLVKGTALVRGGTGPTRGRLKVALTNGTEDIFGFSDEIVTTTATQLVCVRIK